MFNYPLRLNLKTDSPEDEIRALDATKKDVLYRPGQSEDVREGRKAGVILNGREDRRPRYKYLIRTIDGKRDILVSTPDDLKLGRVLRTGETEWQILDAQDLPFGEIREKGTYKRSCLFVLLTASIWEDLSKLIFPHCYEVKMRAERVLLLREHTDTLTDDYFLKKKGAFNEREEALLLAALISILAV